jgi:hypothetical protein
VGWDARIVALKCCFEVKAREKDPVIENVPPTLPCHSRVPKIHCFQPLTPHPLQVRADN